MIIVEIDIIPIRAPRKEVVRAGTGANPITHSEFGIVRILTDEGIEGVGEISITAPRIGHTLCLAARTLVAPALIGMDPLALPVVFARIERVLGGELSSSYLLAAFEMALLDISGKMHNIPVYQLLGGAARPAVPLAWAIYQKSPEEMAADAGAAVVAGFHAIKLKVGRALQDDLAAARSVAGAVNNRAPLRLDANTAWRTIPEAVHAIDAFAEFARIAWVEQPLGRHNLEGLRMLRQRCAVPIMVDESLQNLRDAYDVVRAEAADVFNVYISEAGGILAAKRIFDFAQSLDIPCIIGSQAELGIGTVAAAHLGVAVGDLPYACETFGTLRYPLDIAAPTPRIENGNLFPPDGPGLGIQLNWEVVNAWRVDL
jgi:L-alanine-DL-glutamate epimerase-like enolase superfamily enzyme